MHILEKHILFVGVTTFCFLINCITLGADTENLSAEEQEYKQELTRIKSFIKTLTPEPTNDLKKYEEFANQIQSKWSQKNKEYYAYLMLEICRPLASISFKDQRRHDLRRQYALSALGEPNEIAVLTELELIGRVVTFTIEPNTPKGKDFAERRKKDVLIRLHAWKRLIDAIDPNWDSNDLPYLNVPLPEGADGQSGMSPKHIKDPNLRAQYEEAIEKNRQKAERYSEQRRLRDWQKRFPVRVESYIIQAYSKPPFNFQELQKLLSKYLNDDRTKQRILETVNKNIEQQNQNTKNYQANVKFFRYQSFLKDIILIMIHRTVK